MAINARAVYYFDANFDLVKHGSLTGSGTSYAYSATEATINQGDINTKQIVIAVPLGTFTGGAPFLTIMPPKGRPTTLLAMSAATWTISGMVTGVSTFQVFYYTLGLVGNTFYAGRHAMMCGYLTNTGYSNLDVAYYTVQDGISNYELIEADTYEEIYTSLAAVFADHAARITALEADKVNVSAISGTAAEIAAGIDADTIVYSKLKADEAIAAASATDQAYTDTEVGKIVDGTYTADKATKDAAGNTITTTYATKAEDAAKVPLTYLDTDGTLAANSDTKVATQKATKTYADTKIAATEKAAALGVATLDASGKVPSSQMGSYAITNTFEVASEVAMLALSTAEMGDVAVRSDENKSYILGGAGDYATLADWILLRTPTDTVLSVNGETGAVTIDASDIATDQVGQTIQDAIDIIETDVDAAELAITTLESEMDAAQADIITHTGDIATINASLASQTANNVAAQDFLSRQKPYGALEKSSAVATDARKDANLNRYYLSGLTIKNLVKNGNFVNTANWTNIYTAYSSFANVANKGVITVTGAGTTVAIYQSIPLVANDVYYIHFKMEKSAGFNGTQYVYATGATEQSIWSKTNALWQDDVSVVFTSSYANLTLRFFSYNAANLTNGGTVSVSNVKLVNLTTLGTHPSGVHWHDMTAAQIDAFIGNLDTTAQIVAKAVAGGETTKLTNGEFATAFGAPWASSGAGTPTVSAGICSFTPTTQFGRVYQEFTTIIGHTYYYEFNFKGASSEVRARIYDGASVTQFNHDGDNAFHTYSRIVTATSTAGNVWVYSNQTSGWSQIDVDYIRVYDITSYYRTADLISCKPKYITANDGTNTVSNDISSLFTSGFGSLPDGQKDEIECKVNIDPTDTTYFQTRRTTLTKRTLRLDLPGTAVTDGWEMRLAMESINGEFTADYTGWTATNCGTPTVAGGAVTFTPTANNGGLYQSVSTVSGHKYYVCANVNTAGSTSVVLKASLPEDVHSPISQYEVMSVIVPASSSTMSVSVIDKLPAYAEITVDYIRVYDLTSIFGGGNEPTSTADFETFLTNSATYTAFRINLYSWTGASAGVWPADNDTIANAYTSSLSYALDDFNDMIVAAAGGISITKDGRLFLMLPNATADTLAELYTYLVANPLSVIVEIADEVTYPTNIYAKQVGNGLTVDVTSDTAALPGDWEVDYCIDTNKRSFTTAQRPVNAVAGQTIFDSTLGKMILYNGSAWVNLDGTALS